MWFEERPAPDWTAAEEHLVEADPVLAKLIPTVGPCKLSPLPDPYQALVLSVFSQQLSVKGAETLYGRFRSRFTQNLPTPRKVAAALDPASPKVWDDETIKACGISRQKRSYLLDLSQRIASRQLSLKKLEHEPDDEVERRLTEVKGIGAWTAHMYLMFVLLRPDIWPTGDLGLREGTRKAFELAERPSVAVLEAMGEPWRPYRSVACWYLWKAKGE